MSIVNDYQEFMKHRWLAVYGASVAIQAHQHLLDGRGGVDFDTMQGFKEEAAAVADLDACGAEGPTS